MRGNRVLIAAGAAAGLAVVFGGGFLAASLVESDSSEDRDEPEEVVITEGERTQLVDACLRVREWAGCPGWVDGIANLAERGGYGFEGAACFVAEALDGPSNESVEQQAERVAGVCGWRTAP